MEKRFLPMSADQLAKFDITKALYMQGHPRTYRFDAKDGRTKDHNGDSLTKSGDPLRITPLSYRMFFAEMFDYSPRTWLEVFFLNAAGQVCSMLFHGYSAQEFELSCAALFYDEAAVNEAEFEIAGMQKEKVLEDGQKAKYFIASFRIHVLPKLLMKKPAAILTALAPIYRAKTYSGNQEPLRWLGYPEKVPQPKGIGAATEPGKEAEPAPPPAKKPAKPRAKRKAKTAVAK